MSMKLTQGLQSSAAIFFLWLIIANTIKLVSEVMTKNETPC